MDKDKLLSAQLAKTAAKGGFVGGGMSGAIGAAAGGWIASKFLTTETISHEFVVDKGIDAAYVLAKLNMMAMGELLQAVPLEKGVGVIVGAVGSGMMNLNKALLEVTLESNGEARTRIFIQCAAKEGIIKQKIASKSLERFLNGFK